MLFSFKNRLPHYFSTHPSREVKEVYWYTIISNMALSMVFIFEPIYLYTLGYSLISIMWFYVMVYSWYLLLVSLGAKFASKFGFKHSIFLSSIFFVCYWFSLFFIKDSPALFFVAPFFFAMQKSWFWPAYDADMALFSAKKQRGREVGMLFSLVQIAFIAGPVLGGIISESFGFLTLFAAASILMILSAYPLFTSPEVYSRHEFKLKNLTAMFRKYPSNFLGYWGYAEDLMVMSLWPIYMYIVVNDFFDLGLISTIATIIGTVIMLYVGRLIDRYGHRHRLIFEASVVYGATWIVRFLAQGVALVLTFDILNKGAKNIVSVPVNAITFERGSDDGPDHAIAYSVFYEFSLAAGKVFTALLAIVILSLTANLFTGLFLTFAVVGALTMFYGFLK